MYRKERTVSTANQNTGKKPMTNQPNLTRHGRKPVFVSFTGKFTAIRKGCHNPPRLIVIPINYPTTCSFWSPDSWSW